MVDFLDPNKLEDTVGDSLSQQLGQKAEVEGHLAELEKQYNSLPEDTPAAERATALIEIARSLQILERGSEAWPIGKTAVEVFLEEQMWEEAADACDVLYQTEEQDALIALGHGIWLGVTFPIDPEITVHLLSHVIDDTPNDSDGAAVAAASAAFLADMRSEEGPDKERLLFFTQQLLGKVARRHSEIDNPEQFSFWVDKLELNDPDKFLPRLRNVVDVLVQADWWFDRDKLQALIPE